MRFLLVAVLALLTACSSNEQLEPMELQKFQASAQLERLWSTKIGSGQDVRYTLLTPVIIGDFIYAVDVDGNLHSLDKSTGKQQWRVKLKAPVSGGVGANADTLFVGTYDAQVIAVNLADGSERWRATVASEVLNAPKANSSTVFVLTFDGKLTALDVNTGAQKWLYETTPPAPTLRGDSSPVVTSAVVYAGFATGKIAAFQVDDGITLWEQRVAIPKGRTEFEKLVDIDGTPILVGEILLAASYQGQLIALSRATGRPLWAKPTSTYNNLSASDGKVYVTTAESALVSYRIGNGQQEWENRELLRRKLNAPQPVGAYVAVADNEDGYLHILSNTDGSFAARTKVDGDGVRSPMVSEGNLLYVLGNSGKLAAYRISPLQ